MSSLRVVDRRLLLLAPLAKSSDQSGVPPRPCSGPLAVGTVRDWQRLGKRLGRWFGRAGPPSTDPALLIRILDYNGKPRARADFARIPTFSGSPSLKRFHFERLLVQTG